MREKSIPDKMKLKETKNAFKLQQSFTECTAASPAPLTLINFAFCSHSVFSVS
jgi:hypothetical protein